MGGKEKSHCNLLLSVPLRLSSAESTVLKLNEREGVGYDPCARAFVPDRGDPIGERSKIFLFTYLGCETQQDDGLEVSGVHFSLRVGKKITVHSAHLSVAFLKHLSLAHK